MCHGQKPLTRNTAQRQKEIPERMGVGEARFRRKRGRQESERGGAPEHACVKRLCHECDEVIDGMVLCAIGHPPLYPLFFFNISITPILRAQLMFFFQENPFGLSQLSAQHRLGPRSTS